MFVLVFIFCDRVKCLHINNYCTYIYSVNNVFNCAFQSCICRRYSALQDRAVLHKTARVFYAALLSNSSCSVLVFLYVPFPFMILLCRVGYVVANF